jgi:hypothetical protein
MTVSSTTSKNTYSGDDSTSVFAYTFRILDQSHIKVQFKASDGTLTTKTITTDYTVSGVGDAGGGNVTIVSTVPATGETLILTRNVPIKQETDYTANDKFPAETHEEALDELTMICQQIDEVQDRAITLDPGVSGVNGELPDPSGNAGKYIRVTSGEDGFEYSTVATTSTLSLPVSVADGGTGDANGELNLLQGANRTIKVNEETSGAGSNLTIKAGDAETAGSDLAGGTLNLEGGAAEGTGTSSVKLRAAKATTSGSTQVTAQDALTVVAEGSTLEPHGTSAGNTGELRFKELAANGTNYVGFKSADSLAGNVIWTLPNADSAGVFTSDGAGGVTLASAGPTQATQAAIEAETDEDTYIPPDLAKHSPGMAKFWVEFDGTGTAAIDVSYNVTSITDNGTGDYTVTIDTDFSGANYALSMASQQSSTSTPSIVNIKGSTTPTAGAVNITTESQSSTPTDVDYVSVVGWGDQ